MCERAERLITCYCAPNSLFYPIWKGYFFDLVISASLVASLSVPCPLPVDILSYRSQRITCYSYQYVCLLSSKGDALQKLYCFNIVRSFPCYDVKIVLQLALL